MQIVHLILIVSIVVLLIFQHIITPLIRKQDIEVEKKYPTSARINERIKRIMEHREAENPYDVMRYRN